MGFHLRIPHFLSGKEFFETMPEPLRNAIRSGFRAFSRIPQQKWGEVRRATLESLEAGRNIDETKLESQLEISKSEARSLLTAASVFAAMLNTGEKLDELVAGAVETKIIGIEDRPAVLAFLGDVSRDREMREALERSRFSTAVLPSLIDLESTVDLRLGYEKKQLNSVFPIALFHLDTDASDQEVWFQATKSQVEKVIKDLQETLMKMDEAEKWARQKPRKPE